MNIRALDKLTIKGFKSIRELQDFKLNDINILIGGNGAGKSNFVEIFRMLREMLNKNFTNYVFTNGGADGFLFNGPKRTQTIDAHFCFGLNEYRFTIGAIANEKFIFWNEEHKYNQSSWKTISHHQGESGLREAKDEEGWNTKHGIGHYVFNAISNWKVYHFHDTSQLAPMRRSEIVEDIAYLRHDAANIAPFLLNLKNGKNKVYQDIVAAVRLVTPFFDDFILEPVRQDTKETIKLMWKQKGSDYPMQPYHFSDGTIRFICLTTALLQPNFPSTIIIDEPELGLHPYAIEILAELIKATAQQTQVIISTQSPALVDCFVPEDIIVVDRENGASTFKRLEAGKFSSWLEDYSLGELWRKNVIAGSPVNE